MTVLLAVLLLHGCAPRCVDSQWSPCAIYLDGVDAEWASAVQVEDGGHHLGLRVANDANALFLCLTITENDFQRDTQRAGLTIWIDPQGGEQQTVGIHLPGQKGRPPSGSPPLAPPDEKATAEQPRRPPPAVSLPETLRITYQDATGPLSMTLDEVRRTGIDIGVARGSDGQLCYEFKIAFRADPSLEGLRPGMYLGLGIQSGSVPDGHPPRSANAGGMQTGGERSGPMGGPPPGGMGPMRGGSKGGPPKGSRSTDQKIRWFTIRLAGPLQDG